MKQDYHQRTVQMEWNISHSTTGKPSPIVQHCDSLSNKKVHRLKLLGVFEYNTVQDDVHQWTTTGFVIFFAAEENQIMHFITLFHL